MVEVKYDIQGKSAKTIEESAAKVKFGFHVFSSYANQNMVDDSIVLASPMGITWVGRNAEGEWLTIIRRHDGDILSVDIDGVMTSIGSASALHWEGDDLDFPMAAKKDIAYALGELDTIDKLSQQKRRIPIAVAANVTEDGKETWRAHGESAAPLEASARLVSGEEKLPVSVVTVEVPESCFSTQVESFVDESEIAFAGKEEG